MPYTIWITGLSASGKSTLGAGLSEHLVSLGVSCELLDGEAVRTRLDRVYGYSVEERNLVVHQIEHMAAEAMSSGKLAIVATISHVSATRSAVRARLGRFFEIYLRCPPEVCAQRDRKGNYARALRGELPNFIGVDEPYEESSDPELIIDTSRLAALDTLALAIQHIERRVLASSASSRS